MLMERQLVVDRFHQSLSSRNFTEEANAHSYRKTLAEQHVHWQEQDRNALNFQQAGVDRAPQECERAAHDEVHVAVARATHMS